VSVEWFYKLKEIDSLTKMRIKHLKDSGEQDDRLSKLAERRRGSEEQTKELNQRVIILQQEMFELDKKLKTASEQRQRMLDLGGDEKKIADFQVEIDQLEEKGFSYLEEIEAAQSEVADAKTFLAGLEKTYQEIAGEVGSENSRFQKEIENIDLRLKLLLEELPSNFRETLEKVQSKNLSQGPFTRVIEGSCYVCRYKISRQDESEIDTQQLLKRCPSCGRIFLPYGA
jgi:predicted  nucleic acid-binding Zn-ribbon protein